MAVLDKEAFMSRLKAHIGEDNSDEAMSLIEDFTDTYNDLETRGTSEAEWQNKLNTANSEWQTKYDTLDSTWRDKYKARFFGSEQQTGDDITNAQTRQVKQDVGARTFDELFTEREG